MLPTRFVKPAADRRVRIPSEGYRPLSDAGEALADDVWLRRRLADGDVVEADPADPAAAPGPEPDPEPHPDAD